MTKALDRARLDLLAAIEAAAVRGWPALETRQIDGWLARCTSGGSVRANSVAALAWTGGDIDVAIGAVERFYGAHGAPSVFTISEASLPESLDARLAERGYARHGDHVTMAKTVDRSVEAPSAAHIAEACDEGWLAVYLCGLSADRRDAAPGILRRLPPASYVSLRRDGRVIASGLTIVDGDLASVQCMATLTQARRTGAATAVLAAIEHHAAAAGARYLYLQTDAGNIAAQELYRRAGYGVVGHYHTRVRTP
jgi:ribosomal protein S18 acetylase RimI-like enzyme